MLFLDLNKDGQCCFNLPWRYRNRILLQKSIIFRHACCVTLSYIHNTNPLLPKIDKTFFTMGKKIISLNLPIGAIFLGICPSQTKKNNQEFCPQNWMNAFFELTDPVYIHFSGYLWLMHPLYHQIKYKHFHWKQWQLVHLHSLRTGTVLKPTGDIMRDASYEPAHTGNCEKSRMLELVWNNILHVIIILLTLPHSIWQPRCNYQYAYTFM